MSEADLVRIKATRPGVWQRGDSKLWATPDGKYQIRLSRRAFGVRLTQRRYQILRQCFDGRFELIAHARTMNAALRRCK